MVHGTKLSWLVLFLPFFAAFPQAHAASSILDGLSTNAPSTNAPPVTPVSAAPLESDATHTQIHDAFLLLSKNQLDEALAKVNDVLKTTPLNTNAYLLRGSIYTKKKMWAEGEKDFQKILEIDPKNNVAKFNLSEVKFMQKQYDVARPGFVALQNDADLADLAAYKVFLCDLFGGHEDVASKELDAFNKAGSNPSYYFGNTAWDLFHHKTEDARSWLKSAVQIYTPNKTNIYASSLQELGYLPLPDPPPSN